MGGERAARVVAPAVVGTAMLGLWFVFAGTFSWHELVAGAAASVISAYGWAVAARSSGAGSGGRAAWFGLALRLPPAIARDTWRLLEVLARQLLQGRQPPSLLVAVRFEGGGRDPSSAMRRALGVVYTAATPGSVVVGLDPERGLMLVHHVWHGAGAPFAEALGTSE